MALPLLGVIPAFTMEGFAFATSVSGFFAYLWSTNLKKSDGSYDFSFDGSYEALPLTYQEMQTNLKTYSNELVATTSVQVSTYQESIPQVKEIDTTKLNQNISEKSSLIELMKASNLSMIEHQKVMNNQMTILNNLLLKLFEAKSNEVINQNVQNTLLSENFKALNLSVSTLATLPKITAETQEYNLLMSAQILSAIQSLETSLNGLTTATKEQELKLNTESVTMGDMVVDMPSLVNVLEKGVNNQISTNNLVSEGITYQMETNSKIIEGIDKKNEHLDFLKDGLSTLKDSSGKVIKPREVQAKNHAEHQIYKTSENTFDWKSSLVETYTDLESNFDPSNLGFGTEGDNLLTLLTKLVSFDPKKFETDESKIFGKAKT